ncbi:hypothetical protein HY468_03515 [Candidatus Roizmanbacteria bacterium]|nr:hypothetical protein [Candidatus Roizmanbacteria bacterium]
MNKTRWLMLVGFCGVLVNIVVLYWLLFRFRSDVTSIIRTHSEKLDAVIVKDKQATPQNLRQEEKVSTVSEEVTCGQVCVEKIDDLTDRVKQLELTSQVQPTMSPSSTTVVSSSEPTVKELLIPLGSGKTNLSSWTDVPGLNAYIDTNNYGRIKSVRFEASLRVPSDNGWVYVRLYNITDNHPVWFSEIYSERSKTVLKESDPILLDNGNKLYQVQMKNTLGAESLLDSARIKIILE